MQTTIKMPEAKVRQLIAEAEGAKSDLTGPGPGSAPDTPAAMAVREPSRVEALLNTIATRVTTPISISEARRPTPAPHLASSPTLTVVSSTSETVPSITAVTSIAAGSGEAITIPVVATHIPSLEIPLVNAKRGVSPLLLGLSPDSAIPISLGDFDVEVVHSSGSVDVTVSMPVPSMPSPLSTPTTASAVESAPPLVSGVRIARRSTLPAAMRCDALFRVLASMRVELDPIFDVNHLRVIGHEARVAWPKDDNASVVTHTNNAATDLLDVRLQRRARELAVAAFNDARQRLNRVPNGGVLFIDVFPNDLLDPELFRQDTPLARIADKVVLQLRGSMSGLVMEDLTARISVLRFQGFRFAVADIDATPSRLSLLAEISPEYIKLDASITSGVSEIASKRRVIEGLAMMCTLLGATPIAEGVATVEDRQALAEAGCPLVQGPLHSDDLAAPVTVPKTIRRAPAPAQQQHRRTPNALKRVAAR